MKVIFLLTTLSFLFSGCAAMSVEQCKTANWRYYVATAQ